MNPKVAIVIVTWNKKDYVLNLLSALEKNRYDNYDVIVIDNASTDCTQDEILKRYPKIHLIRNNENLGGTGGFNTGLRYALRKDEYKYIWMLDNDAMVEEDTLIELVQVMEKDEWIGIAGSMILNPENKNLIVELGAHIEWGIGTWRPYLRNAPLNEQNLKETTPVDYVAACSALVRTKALTKAGIMDDRYFLHWDDIELCLRISRAGYNVVGVSGSKIYHGVEKGFNPFILYYDIRNGLLTISKHKKGLSKIRNLLNLLRVSCKSIFYSFSTQMKGMGILASKAITDFIKGNFYKVRIDNNIDFTLRPGNTGLKVDNLLAGKDGKKILVFPNGNFEEIKKLIGAIKALNKSASITLLIQSDRKNLFLGLEVNDLLTFDGYRQSIFQSIALMARIIHSNYDLAVSPAKTTLPFSHATKKYFIFDSKNETFYENRENITRFWKLLIIVILSEAMSFFLFPFVYLASFRYSNQDGNTSRVLKQ